MKKQQLRKIRDQGIVLFYTLFIYISLPAAPGLWESFAGYTGNFANYLAVLILGLVVLVTISYLISKRKGIRSVIWLAAIASAYIFGLSKLELSIERIHFVEYGLLAALVFRALRHNIKGKSLYLWSGLVVSFLGLLDEGIQYLLPNRVYQTTDVVVNASAGILALVVIAQCFQPELK